MNDYINVMSKKGGYYDNVPSFNERSTMGKEQFLRLLVEQLKNQDPLQPLEDREFIAQMTQFSNLEQLINLNQAMTVMMNLHLGNALSSQSQLIGKTVDWALEKEKEIIEGQGVVKGIILVGNELWAELESGLRIPVDSIYRVWDGNKPGETPPDEDEDGGDDDGQGDEQDGVDEVGDDDENV
jgi:flagellar basal-body rod modification protein FlgD